MAGRKPKLTTDSSDRPEQRKLTAELMAKQENWDTLQTRAPKHLAGVARSTWTTLVPALNKQGLVKQIDKQIVTALCEQIQIERDSYLAIQELGIVLPNGKKNPACQVLDSATAKVKSLSDSLGLNPQARASLVKVETTNSNEDEADILVKLAGGDEESW